jgi:hypothetical protein
MPLAARVNVQLIEEINRAIATVRPSDDSREPEIGGVLLGFVEGAEGERPVVRVERMDPINSEHRRGLSFVLSDRDKKVLARKLDWWNNHRVKEGLRPVGFFRSHTRRGLYLDNEDFALFQRYFPEPAALFLLVRPAPGADNVGGFFFWDKGDIHREASYQEFPFAAGRLPLVTEPAAAPEPAQPVAAQPAPPPEPVPAPPIVQPVAMPPAARPTMQPAMQPTMQATAQPAAQAAPAAVKLLPLKPVIPPAERRPVSMKWMQVALPLIIGVILGAVVFEVTKHTIVTPGTQPPARTEVAKAAPSAPPSTPLVVEKPSPLEAKSRPVVVTPPTPPPTVATARPPRKTWNADRVANSAAPPAPTGSTAHTAPKEGSVPAVTAVVTPPPAAEPPPAPVAAPLPPITAPVRVERPRRAASMATVTVEPVSGSKLGRIVGHIPGLRRKPKDFVPARPIHQVTPVVPADEHLARNVPVDLRIKVDPAGNVAEVEQASHGADRELVRLASDAARSWHFVPARKNDETVSSELILHFMFPGSPDSQP